MKGKEMSDMSRSAAPLALASPKRRWGQLALGILCMVMIANLQYGWTLFVNPIDPGLQHPKDAVENTAVVHPCYGRRLVRQHGLDGGPFVVGKCIAHDSKLPSLGA
jgi:hypothetical protein